MMLATDTSKEACLLSNVYRVTKKNTISRLQRGARQYSDGFKSANQCLDGEAMTLKVRPTTSIDSNKEDANFSKESMTTPQFKRRQSRHSEDFDTPLREKRRITGRNSNRSKPKLRTRTPGKNFDLGLQLDDGQDLGTSLSSSNSSSPSITQLLTPDASSPLCISSPGRNWQSSQDPRDIIWDCISPINQYIRRSARDSSNIDQMCRPWQNFRWEKKENKEMSLLDKWISMRCPVPNCIKPKPEEMGSSKKDTSTKKSLPGAVFMELVGLMESTKKDSLSAKLSRTPAKCTKVKSPNSSMDDLWGDEDESFIFQASQFSPILFADQSAEARTPDTSHFTSVVEKKYVVTSVSTPLRPPRTQSRNREDKTVSMRKMKDSSCDLDDLWNDDDDSELFSQEVLTLLEQQITEATKPHKCTPEEILRKRQDALSKRTRVWNGRLRTPR